MPLFSGANLVCITEVFIWCALFPRRLTEETQIFFFGDLNLAKTLVTMQPRPVYFLRGAAFVPIDQL